MHGSVQSLTTGETLDFAAAVMQQLGRDLPPEKIRYFIGHKKELGQLLRKFMSQALEPTVSEKPEFARAPIVASEG